MIIFKNADYYDSGSDFDKWCDLKGYGKKDPVGKKRSESNIWFKEHQNDIENGNWVEAKYCSFIDMFQYFIEDLGNDESDDVYTIYLDLLLKMSKEEDLKEFKKEDYRTRLAQILLNEFGTTIEVTQLPE